jgi:hypothetical protein
MQQKRPDCKYFQWQKEEFMRKLTIITLFFFSNLCFAGSNVRCLLKVAAPGAQESKTVADLLLTVSNTHPHQAIGSWGGLDFSLVYHDSGAAGPFDTVGIEWTDGANTFGTKQIYAPGFPIFQNIYIEGKIGTVYGGCEGLAPTSL